MEFQLHKITEYYNYKMKGMITLYRTIIIMIVTFFTIEDIYSSNPQETYHTKDLQQNIKEIKLKKNILKITDKFGKANETNILSQKMLNSSRTRYIINYNYDLNGSKIIVPKECILDFQGGSISNGTVVLNKTKIINGHFDARIEGTFQNDTIYSSWFANKEEIILSAISSCCNNSKTFKFTEGRYVFKKDICIYNGINLIGEKEAYIDFYFDSTGKEGIDARLCGIICGAKERGLIDWGDKKTWTGKLLNLNIACYGKIEFNSLIYLGSAKNCVINECTLDVSQIDCLLNTGNAVICRKNSINISIPSKCQNINITNNTIICDDESFRLAKAGASFESIGLANCEDIYVYNNVIYRQNDDLGLHSCKRAYVKKNHITAYDAGLFASGSNDVWFEKNIVDIQGTTAMGILLRRESANPSNNIHIIGNKVIATDNGRVAYGVRIWSGNNITIENNDVNAIVVEAIGEKIQNDTLTEEDLKPNNIKIHNNRVNGIRISSKPAEPMFFIEKNYIKNYLIAYVKAKIGGNIYSDSFTNYSMSEYNYEQELGGFIDFYINPEEITTNKNYSFETVNKQLNYTFNHRVYLGYIYLFLPMNSYLTYNLLNLKIFIDNVEYKTSKVVKQGLNKLTINIPQGYILKKGTKLRMSVFLHKTDIIPSIIKARIAYVNIDNPGTTNMVK